MVGSDLAWIGSLGGSDLQHSELYWSYKHQTVFIIMNCIKNFWSHKRKPVLPTVATLPNLRIQCDHVGVAPPTPQQLSKAW